LTPLGEWRRCKPWIEAAIKRTPFYDIEDVEQRVEAGEYCFWPGQNAAAITEFITYPNGKALNVFAGGGESNASLLEFLEEFEPAMCAWAKANDCRWVIGFGRPGWGPLLNPRGYRALWHVMSKEV
jgi:hypothetical protein